MDFEHYGRPVFVGKAQWVGVDLDGTLSRNDGIVRTAPPYPLGQPIPDMVAMVKSLQQADVVVKIFTARACEAASIPSIQDWAESHGLGRLEVTNQKDFGLVRYYDDRAIQMVANRGVATVCSPSPSVVMKYYTATPIRGIHGGAQHCEGG